jgi:hypothetical protein
MTLHSFVGRLAQLFSWLYYQHQWKTWELLAIAGAALVPLLLLTRQERKERSGRICTHHDHGRSPTIGLKLAAGKRSRPEITDSKEAHLDYAARGKNKQQDDAPKQESNLSEQIRRLQREIAEYRQSEVDLKGQLAELTAANKTLQEGLAKCERLEEFLKRQADSTPAGDKLPPKGLSTPAQETSTLRDNPKHPTGSRHANEPLDVQRLRAIAALAKQIHGRPRPELRQTKPPVSD